MPQADWLSALLHDRSSDAPVYRWTTANIAPKSLPTYDIGPPHAAQQRIFILGVGNLGRLFATSLAKLPDRPPITLVVRRTNLLKHWASDPGIEMTRSGVAELNTDFDIEMWSEDKPSYGPVQEIADSGGIGNLIVATKAQTALPLVDRLRRYLGPESSVVFTQNGVSKLWPPQGAMYSEARFAPCAHPNWLACVVTHGVTSSGDFKSTHASPAGATLGVLLSNNKDLADSYLVQSIVAAPHLAARFVPTAELWALQLEKVVVNAIINPLTAILRCKNGVLFEPSNWEIDRLMDILLKEASAVLTCLNEQEDLRNRFSFPKLKAMLHLVGAKVGENTSSMLQDVRAGRQTEIREFNGWLVDTARQHGDLSVAAHKTLIDLVEQGIVLEKSQLGNYFPNIVKP